MNNTVAQLNVLSKENRPLKTDSSH